MISRYKFVCRCIVEFLHQNKPHCVSDFKLQYLIVCKYFWQLFIYQWKYFYFTFFHHFRILKFFLNMYQPKFIHFLDSSRFSHFPVIELYVMFEFSVVNSPEFCKISVTILPSPKSFHFSDYASEMLIRFFISSEIFPFRVSAGRFVHFRSIAVTVSLDLTHCHCNCEFSSFHFQCK